MLDLLSAAPACLALSVEQSHMAEDARVGSSDLMDSGARGDSSAVEVPEEGVDTLSELMDMEEMLREHPLIIEVPSQKKRL